MIKRRTLNTPEAALFSCFEPEEFGDFTVMSKVREFKRLGAGDVGVFDIAGPSGYRYRYSGGSRRLPE